MDLSSDPQNHDNWPERQLQLCGEFGVFKWFIADEYGGSGYSDREIVKGYLNLASACLTTTFVITQLTGACKRIAAAENRGVAARLLPDLAQGHSFATLGISHLTTSSRHLHKPILIADETDSGWLLNGTSPWVTGAGAAKHIVIGSEIQTGGQILFAVPTELPGVKIGEPNKLVALSGSCTGQVYLKDVLVGQDFVLSGPKENVLKQGKSKSTGGLQTSALAIGLGSAAVRFLSDEAVGRKRDDLLPNVEALTEQQNELTDRILSMAAGKEVCSNEQLRTDANSFALRATQSALVAAKGAGFVAGHPVGRWCREALFFLVWSCPQAVRDANLCELAGIAD